MPGAEIFVTFDGTLPNDDAMPYDGPIRIDSTTVLRARVLPAPEDGPAPLTRTFLFSAADSLPIVSLVVDPEDLHDESNGIYANPEQRGRAWERDASVELFWPRDQMSPDARILGGVRIHGGHSRKASPKKSFRLYFRKSYGPKTWDTVDLLDDGPVESKRLVLRAGFSETWTVYDSNQHPDATFVRDQTARDLHRAMGHVSSRGNFVNLYLNGEYFGLYNICERIDGPWLERRLGNAQDGWDLLKTSEVKEGDANRWRELMDFVGSNDLEDDAAYRRLETLVDLGSFIDFFVLQIWLQNYDWPHHNWYAARPRTDDGRWIFFVWDAEFSFGAGAYGFRVDHDTLRHAREEDQGELAVLFDALLRNAEFRARFLERLDVHLEGALAANNVRSVFDAAVLRVEPAIAQEAARWGDSMPHLPARGVEDFEAALARQREFIEQRGAYVRAYARALDAGD